MYRITLSSTQQKNNTYSVIIRVYSKGTRAVKRVDKRITVKELPNCRKEDWNFDAAKYRRNFKNVTLYNNMLDRLKEKCDKIYKTLLKDSSTPSVHKFVEIYKNYDTYKTRITLSYAITYKVKLLESKSKWGSARVYRETLNRWNKFIESEYRDIDISISSLTTEHLKEFTAFLLKGRGKGGVKLRIRTLKTCYNLMLKEGIVTIESASPFDKFDYSISDQDSKAQAPLTKEEWIRLKEYQPDSENRAFWKDVFMMMVYGQGINLKDLVLLKPSNIIEVLDNEGNKIEAIRYIRSKTKGTRKNASIEIYYTPELKALIEKYYDSKYKYLIPIIELNTKGKCPEPNTEKWFKNLVKCRLAFNFQLRMIAKDLNLPKHFSNYAARHTFASLLFWEGVDIRIISQALGHKTQEITHEYLSKLDLITMKNNIKGIL